MSDKCMNLDFVSDNLLVANNLQQNDLLSLLEMMNTRNIDYGDLYFQSSYYESWIIENSLIKDGSYNIDQGVGIRVINGEKTGFVYTDQLNFNALTKSVMLAKSILCELNEQKDEISCKLCRLQYNSLYPRLDPLSSFSREEKISLLIRVDKIARSVDRRVQEVTASLSGVYEQVLVASTDGTLVADVRPMVRLSINVQVEQDGKREQGNSGGGGRFGYNFFLENVMGEIRVDSWAKDAVRMALINLSAISAPAGTMPVVLSSGWPGILLHEAVGHGLEGDFNRRCSSVFNGKVGQKVASELCTIVDNGAVSGLRGSLSIDDEGIPSKCNILIKQGILRKYMQDKLNARLMGEISTGNGRRESYAHLPMPRMTNTYMLAGQSTAKEIIDSVDYGIYASNFGGGQVDITSGQFVFSTSEAYLIKKGHISTPVKGATLIGSGIEVMQQISMVGNDLNLDKGVGICIKNGQRIPVGVGQPTLKLNKITVGGTS